MAGISPHGLSSNLWASHLWRLNLSRRTGQSRRPGRLLDEINLSAFDLDDVVWTNFTHDSCSLLLYRQVPI